MFVVRKLSEPNKSGMRQIKYVDCEWDYSDAKANWTRALSFIPNYGHVWIRTSLTWTDVNVVIEYGN